MLVALCGPMFSGESSEPASTRQIASDLVVAEAAVKHTFEAVRQVRDLRAGRPPGPPGEQSDPARGGEHRGDPRPQGPGRLAPLRGH